MNMLIKKSIEEEEVVVEFRGLLIAPFGDMRLSVICAFR